MEYIMPEYNKCSGCGACMQICPVSCISMLQDDEGFLYPFVDEERCIKCGKCNQVCPIDNCSQYNNVSYFKGYVAYAKDEAIRVRSASGGMFSVLAEKVLSEGGIVFGAAFDEKFQVHHIGITSKQEIDILRRSKYVQSRTENTYKEVKAALEEGRIVLYTGTPCQITGLKAYLGNDYEKLYTVDLICFGVPSPALWERYLEEQKEAYSVGADSIKNISFRSKAYGWGYAMKIEFESGASYLNAQDRFKSLFISGVCLRKSCYGCKYRTLDRSSDITLGDAWGIDRYLPDMNDGMGASDVLLHTRKGERFFECIRSALIVCEVEKDFFMRTQAVNGKQRKMHKKRRAYIDSFIKGGRTEELKRLIQPGVAEQIAAMAKKAVRGLLGNRVYDNIKISLYSLKQDNDR